MSGVDGAIKLNSFNAPSVKNTETEKSASAFAVAKKPKKLIEKSAEKTVEEFVKDLIEIPVEEFAKEEETVEEIVEPVQVVEETVEEVVEDPIIPIPDFKDEKPLKKKGKGVDLKAEFTAVKDFIFKMYENVFDKTPSFKPTFEQTVGDLLLYLSNKLSYKNAQNSYNEEFGLTDVKIPSKYDSSYIPLCLKLAKWCEDNGEAFTAEELLYLISSLYLSSAKVSSVIITELDVAIDFDAEINYSL